MTYDEALAGRIRDLVGGQSHLEEKKMFGGLAFLIGGNMAIAASGQGGMLVRADPSESDKLIATTNAETFEMRGRTMKGWLRVAPEYVRTKPRLAKWVEVGTTYARSLQQVNGQLPSALMRAPLKGGRRRCGEDKQPLDREAEPEKTIVRNARSKRRIRLSSHSFVPFKRRAWQEARVIRLDRFSRPGPSHSCR